MGSIPKYLKAKRSAGKFGNARSARKVFWLATLAACALFGGIASPASSQAPIAQDVAGQKLKLLQPLNGATVRETVPIRMSRSVLPTGGYVAILVDGVFRTARVVPSQGDLLYDWDTKAPYTTPDDPDQPQYTQDGAHDIVVQVFDHDGNLIGEGQAHVRVANKITALPDGVHLIYHWSLDEQQRYHYTSTLTNDQSDSGGAKQDLQQADLKFERSVEDVTGAEYLLRDIVLPNGFISSSGTPVLIQAAYDLKSRYRTVNRYGEVLVNNLPFAPGDHFGFPIPQFPARRVNVGDSWESHMEVSLGWDALHPTVIAGTAKLDSYEWQNGYPTAKIIETYEGPATFRLNQAGGGAEGSGQAGLQPVNASDIHITRTVWFAYNSGRLIRMETDMTVTANMTGAQISALGVSGSSAPVGGAMAATPGAPGGGTNFSFAGPQGGPPTAFMFGGPRPGPRTEAPTTETEPQTQTKLVVHDVTSLIGV